MRALVEEMLARLASTGDATGSTTDVTVIYSVNGGQRDEITCVLLDGYSTHADIPKMIAIKRDVDVSAVEIHALVSGGGGI